MVKDGVELMLYKKKIINLINQKIEEVIEEQNRIILIDIEDPDILGKDNFTRKSIELSGKWKALTDLKDSI